MSQGVGLASCLPKTAWPPTFQPEDKVDADYAGDLKGLFAKDNAAKTTGVYPAAKHHQEYQEYLQSAKTDRSHVVL